MILRQDLENLLTKLEKYQESVNNELAECPDGTLMQSNGKNRNTLFQITYTDGKRCRRCINRDPKMIAALARKKYLETERDILETDVRAVKEALAQFCEPFAENILRKMPEKYQKLPKEFFYKDARKKTEGEKWADAPYCQSNYLIEKRQHLTSRGMALRSKSEVIIAEKLYESGIPFRYEQVLTIGKYSVSPDFTLMRSDGKIFYWEHCGLTNSEKYMSHHKWKLNLYETADIVPWKNLIVTYDNEEGQINLGIIESEIKNKLI